MNFLSFLLGAVTTFTKKTGASGLKAAKMLLVVGLLTSGQWASAQVLSIAPTTWNVIGLDSNRPVTDGPDTFPVGARVCNTGGAAVTGLSATLNLGAGSTVISISGASSIVYGTLSSGTATAQSPSQ